MIKLYVSQPIFVAGKKLNAFPLLAEFYDGATGSFTARGSEYATYYRITDDIDDCDVIVLANALSVYHEERQTDRIKEFVRQVDERKKPGWVFSGGDFGYSSRSFSHERIFYFRLAGYASRLCDRDIMMPSWVKDPFQTRSLELVEGTLPYTDRPQVGFCGHSTFDLRELITAKIKVNVHNIRSVLGRSPFETSRQFVSPYQRKRVLSGIRKSNLVDCSFIERKKYRAGVTENKDAHPTTREYYENISQNQYSIAIRGGGNFSVRFFDICAMGRIPVFFNFDSPLPFKERLLRENLLVEIDPSSKSYAHDILRYHQSAVVRDNFRDLQQRVRRFWKDHYTKLGFYREIHDLFSTGGLPKPKSC